MTKELGIPPRQLAEKLKEIYEQPFGGKKRGRFRTSRTNFRNLAGLPVLSDGYISEVYQWLLRHNLILMNLDSAFCVFPATIAKGFRRVPRDVFKHSAADQ
ncbi:MAG: hypothetical protein Q7O12_05695 [Deltaproteobacteria bacterium]|nr:hypothetical protein [Deltaproteobacteria bacterium]